MQNIACIEWLRGLSLGNSCDNYFPLLYYTSQILGNITYNVAILVEFRKLEPRELSCHF